VARKLSPKHEVSMAHAHEGGQAATPNDYGAGPFGTTPTMMRLPEVGSSEVFAIPWRSASSVLAQTVPMVGDLGVVATTQRFSTPGTDLLNPISLHHCRHTFASLLIDSGANPKAIQEFMGHSKIQTTFDVYGHLLPGSHDEVRKRMDAYLRRS
jgi:hypothetical protein